MITIDARWINTSGIGTYLKNILPGVIESFPNIDFCLLGDLSVLGAQKWTKKTNVRLISVSSSMYSVAEQFEIVRKIPKETSIFWATHYNIPLFYRGRILVTVYDLFHLARPELVGGLHKRLYAKVMFTAVRYRAAAILTISRFTKDEFIRLTDGDIKNIFPIHLGIADDWFHIPKANKIYSKEYILFVGNVKPHKNIRTLIKAFGLIYKDIPHDLIIVGKREGFITGDQFVAQEAKRLGDRVQFTGYVKDKELHQYFANADALVFPSLYEGFGFPPLEAMAAGCPVLVSNVASMPEICGDAAVYFNPYSPDDIATKLADVLTNEYLRESMRIKGYEQARSFVWSKCVKQTCDVISALL
jgi:glycosyltransferase involved in cell wall biosynthesis